jgi:hypothetical protein
VARYPHDPRARLYRGSALLDARDFASAERELRAGLAEQEILKTTLVPARTDALLRTNLSIALYGSNQMAEAKTVAQPLCQASSAETATLRETLKRIRVCN